MSLYKRFTSLPWTAIFSGLSTFIVRFALLSLFLILVIVIYRGLNQEGYSVQSFQVPKSLNDAGYNGQVVALLLQDHVQELKVLANSQREDSLDLNVNMRPDLNLDVMGVGLSSSSMIYHLRDLLGHENYTIGGNITDMDGVMKMNIRMTDYQPLSIRVPYREAARQEALMELVDKGAMYILKNTDPYRLAVVHHRRDDVESSENLLRHMIVERPRDRKWAYNFWANIKNQEGSRDEAIEMYLKSIEQDENFALPRRSLGWAYFRQKKYVAALEQFERSLEVDPLSQSAYNGAAICNRELGDLDKANSFYQSQLDKFPQSIWAYGNYSSFLMEYRKDTIGATQLWKKASENIEVSGDYYVALGAFYLMQEDSVQALSYAMQALELEPENISVLQQLSSFNYYELQNYAEAENYYRTLVKVYREGGYDAGMMISAYNMLSMSEYQQEKWDSALVHVQLAIDIMPEASFPYSTLAEIYILKNERANFYEAIEKAISLGFPMERYLDEHPYNLLKDQSRLLALIAKYKDELALKG